MSNAGIKYNTFGFFDESGKLADTEVVVFGGLVGQGEAFPKFAYQWGERLRRDELMHTSMKSALRYEGGFESWSRIPERRDALLLDLAKIIFEAPMMRTASYLTSGEFRSLPQQDRKLYGDPHYCCFEACINGILGGRDDFSLNVTCDLSEEYSEKCVKMFHRMRYRNPAVKARCYGISFLDDKFNNPLQAADMIAFCARAERYSDRSKEEPIVTALIDLFSSQDRKYGKLRYDVGSLGLGSGRLES